MRRLVSGTVFKYGCVSFSRRENKGREGEKRIFMWCTAQKMGLVWGEDVIPLERRERGLQKGQLGFLGWDVKTQEPGRSRVRSPLKSPVAHTIS